MQIINKYLKSTSLVMAIILSLTFLLYPVNSAYATSKSSFGNKASASVQEFKSSFDGVFTPKWFISKFGIKMGYHLIDCIQNKKCPSVKAVVKSMMTADYVAGAVGGVLGGAVGSLFVPFLSTIPIFGGLLADFVPTIAYYLGADISHNVVDDAKTGKFSIKNVFKKIDWISVVTGGIGWSAGSMLGAAIFPPIGSMVGGIIGDLVMEKVGNKIRTFFGKGDASPPAARKDGGPVSLSASSANSATKQELMPSSLLIEGNTLKSTKILMSLNNRYQELYKKYVSAVNSNNSKVALATSNAMKSLQQQLARFQSND